MVPLAQFSSQCQQGGKSLKTLIPRSKLGKLPAAENHNDHLAFDFAGQSTSAPENKNCLLAAIDHETNWPNATFVREPTAERVRNFMHEHIAQFGTPKESELTQQLFFAAENVKNFVRNSLLNRSNAWFATTAETKN